MNHTQKDKQSYKTRQDRAKQAEYEACAKAPPPKTWSARMPAYAGTKLCAGKEVKAGE